MSKFIALLLSVCVCLSYHAAEEVVSTESANAVIEQAEHLNTILDLKSKSKAAAAVSALVETKHAGVKYLLQRLKDRTIQTYKTGVVFVAETETDADGNELAHIYPALIIPNADGSLDASKKQVVSKSEVATFRVARKARKEITRALSIIGLYLEDESERLAAATYVGNKRLAEAMPILEKLIAEESVPKIQFVMRESMALIVAASDDSAYALEPRLESIAALGDMNSIRALDLLKEKANGDATNPEEREVALASIEAIESHQTVTEWIQHAFSGLSLGSILLLTSLGLAVTFGLMGVINMAHGEMLMIGAVTAWACFEFIGTALPEAWFNWYYVIAIPMSFLTAGCIGILIELSIVRFLYKRPLDSMLATIGVSYILIQAVRSWKGDNLGMTAPSWFSGGWEVMQDVVLPYNRIFIILLTFFSVLSVWGLFKYTRFGLMLRATVQNRDVAAANGVNTRMVDMLTFGLGSGLAGIAGCALVLLTNPTPEMGQTYIVKSFLVTVVAGVGSLLGVIYAAFGLGFLEKFIEPLHIMDEPFKLFDSTWAQVFVLAVVIFFMQRRPGGLFPERGRNADKADPTAGAFLAKVGRRGDIIGLSLLFGIGALVVPALYGMGMISPEFVNKLGYILTFAICAIGLDLLWGYTGVLSLCQALFFALGAYVMGLYLINHGPKDLDGIPDCLSYVMSDVSNRQAPWFLDLFETFSGTLFLGVLLPGICALLIGLMVFRSRVKGVYFAILTQAITVGANLVFMKNDLKLGGTNGLTKFEQILGAPIAYSQEAGLFGQTRFWLYMSTLLVLMAAVYLSRKLANGGLGRVLIATRDDETRLRFSGYQVWAWKALIFGFAAVLAAIAGMLYAPQKGIINPHQMTAEASIMVVAWVAVGGRGTVWGAVLGAVVVGLMYDWITSFWPQGWKFLLGAMFIAVPLALPGGLLSLNNKCANFFKSKKETPSDDSAPLPASGGAA